MTLDLKILQGEHNNREKYPIGSGDILTIMVDNGGSLKNMRVVLYDQDSQIRFIHRRKRGIAHFETPFPQITEFAKWKLVLRAIGPGGDHIEISKDLYVDKESKTEAPTEVVESEAEIEVSTDPVTVEADTIGKIDKMISVPLTVLAGVGKVTANKLNEGGILTLRQLAASTLDEVMKTGLTENKSQTFIQRALEYLKENS